jgi:hypothetical protein
VFEKAYRCKRDNQDRDVLVVVVLDEVGLAEVSSHNPLKVQFYAKIKSPTPLSCIDRRKTLCNTWKLCKMALFCNQNIMVC